GINIHKQILKLPMPLTDIGMREGADGFRTLGIHVTKQVTFNFIIDQGTKKGRIEVELLKAAANRPVNERIGKLDAAIRQCDRRRSQVQIGKRVLAWLKEASLIPSRDVMVVPGRGHSTFICR